MCYMHSNILYDFCIIPTVHVTCSSLEPPTQLSSAPFTFHFSEKVPLTLDENKFLAIRIAQPHSLHSIPSSTAISATFPTHNSQLHSYPCHVPYTQFPVAQLSLPHSLHSIPICTSFLSTFPTLNFQLHNYLCHVPYIQFPVAQLSLPRSLYSIPSCTAFPATFPTPQFPVAQLSLPRSLH